MATGHNKVGVSTGLQEVTRIHIHTNTFTRTQMKTRISQTQFRLCLKYHKQKKKNIGNQKHVSNFANEDSGSFK